MDRNKRLGTLVPGCVLAITAIVSSGETRAQYIQQDNLFERVRPQEEEPERGQSVFAR